jgi:membrane-associated protease RseP (regulator of RpoE activity)
MFSARKLFQSSIAFALMALPLPGVAHDPTDVEAPHGFMSWIYPQGRLGVEVLPMTPALRAHFDVDPETGVLVSQVAPESPAAQAGIEAGDVSLSADDKPITSPGELIRVVGVAPENEKLRIELSRKGSKRQLEIVPRGRPLMTPRRGAQMLGRYMVAPLRELREQMLELEERLRELEKKLDEEGESKENQQT